MQRGLFDERGLELVERQAGNRVRLERDGATGAIDIFVDGSKQPALHATDSTIPSGRVGLGSFDDTGEFRAFSVTGTQK